jgi:hypothetical protein
MSLGLLFRLCKHLMNQRARNRATGRKRRGPTRVNKILGGRESVHRTGCFQEKVSASNLHFHLKEGRLTRVSAVLAQLVERGAYSLVAINGTPKSRDRDPYAVTWPVKGLAGQRR